ncbi:hypothetical protein C8R44DRAFT_840350 [Mycena epipterygia]|nr:hypothetical protein C8R44DRAFT_840350 [Mycena epipterygia]
MFSPFDLPAGILLLVTDQLSSQPISFSIAVSLTISRAKKKTENPKKAIVLSVSENLARWKAIAARSNLHLDQQSSGAFLFIDVLKHIAPPPNADATLRPTLDAVVSALDAADDTLVIVDDLAALDWLGISSVLDITHFCRALSAACRKANATLLTRQHVLTPPTAAPVLDDLFRQLRELCTYHMEVALHAGPDVPPRDGVRLLPRSSALQYKLPDGGEVFLERGTGAGVL